MAVKQLVASRKPRELLRHIAFTNGSYLDMIGIIVVGSSTILHNLSTIKQQVRVTTSTLSLEPRESTGDLSQGRRLTYHTKNADCQFLRELVGVGDRLAAGSSTILYMLAMVK